MGGIGSAVATRAKAFGMKIQYHNRRQLPPNKENGATYVTFEELLKTSDVLSLNLALNPKTKHIIGKPEFDQMRDGVIIVNTARGALIDEAALVDALKSGKVWTAGLDVFEEEPKIHPGLLECENAVLLPHVGTATYETQVSKLLPAASRILTDFDSATWSSWYWTIWYRRSRTKSSSRRCQSRKTRRTCSPLSAISVPTFQQG